MFEASFTIVGVSPYSQSRFHGTPKLDKETSDAQEERTWREKAHIDSNGEVFIPSQCLKNAIDSAAKFLALQIPGKGKNQYTKHFQSGVLINGIGAPLGIKKEDMQCVRLMQNSDGVAGSGKRVQRIFPVFNNWEASFSEVFILDETITRDVFETVLKAAGTFIGIGRWRPEKRGNNGRFIVREFNWEGR